MTFLLLSSLAKISFVLVLLFSFAPLLVWAERRQSAMIQDRVGPHRADLWLFGHRFVFAGLLHPVADFLKMIWKEDFVPPRADKLLHSLAPILTLTPVFLSFAVIPFGDVLHLEALGQVVRTLDDGTWCVLHRALDGAMACEVGGPPGRSVALQIASPDVGVLFIFAVAGAGVIGAALAGYASDNKYSLLGGVRATAQIISYELVLGLTLVGSFLIYGTLRLEEMVRWQTQHVWGIALQPLAAVLYLAAATAENKRVPFDVVEGESEIVGGYFTEYSGMKFGMFFMGEFLEVVLLAALAVTIFFGGWHLPGLDASGLHLQLGGLFDWRWYLPHGAVVALQVGTFVAKLVVAMWFQLMLRWSLPRFRFDQIMRLCWKNILPLALLNTLLTALAVLCFG